VNATGELNNGTRHVISNFHAHLKGMYRRNMSVVSDQNKTLLKRPSRIYRAALPTITCLELGDGVAAQLATQVVLALMLIQSAR
jgi:hypothetical protein